MKIAVNHDRIKHLRFHWQSVHLHITWIRLLTAVYGLHFQYPSCRCWSWAFVQQRPCECREFMIMPSVATNCWEIILGSLVLVYKTQHMSYRTDFFQIDVQKAQNIVWWKHHSDCMVELKANREKTELEYKWWSKTSVNTGCCASEAQNGTIHHKNTKADTITQPVTERFSWEWRIIEGCEKQLWYSLCPQFLWKWH